MYMFNVCKYVHIYMYLQLVDVHIMKSKTKIITYGCKSVFINIGIYKFSICVYEYIYK